MSQLCILFYFVLQLIRVALAEFHFFSPVSGSSVPVDLTLLSLHVATTMFSCATLKHVPFALQFAQPGIITTPLNPSLKYSFGSVPSLAFSAPSTVTFCSFVSSLCLFWQKSKGQSVIPPTQPRGKVTFKQSTAVTCVCTRTHYGQIQCV